MPKIKIKQLKLLISAISAILLTLATASWGESCVYPCIPEVSSSGYPFVYYQYSGWLMKSSFFSFYFLLDLAIWFTVSFMAIKVIFILEKEAKRS